MKAVLDLKEKIPRCCFQQVSRADNNHADSLANLGSAMEFQFRREIPVEHIPHPSIDRSGPEAMRLDTSPEWREPIIQYLKYKILPENKAEALKLQHLAESYRLLGNDLVKSSYTKKTPDPYLLCVGTEEAKALMEEIHGGECGNHFGGRSLAHKIITLGYYWPNMCRDASEYVRKCPEIQVICI